MKRDLFDHADDEVARVASSGRKGTLTAYRDAEGWIYFAGRSADWLRVDSENFAAAPVERILAKHKLRWKRGRMPLSARRRMPR